MATGSQVWSWDITRLAEEVELLLPLLLDIFSRYVLDGRIGRSLSRPADPAELPEDGVQPQVLTLHSDRRSSDDEPMHAQLLADLGVTRSLSRPQVSDVRPLSSRP